MNIADLFCGAGGTSTGAMLACQDLGIKPRLTAINHWPIAVATHEANHPEARHLCASLDSLNPRDLFKDGELDLLWGSPECTHHSIARGGKPISDQSRSTAWCITRWAEALRPGIICVENVKEFREWGPINSKGRPIIGRKGEVFNAWVATLRALGYTVDWRVLCAADYGDPTTRERLFVQAVRGRRKIVWPEATHQEDPTPMLFDDRKRWRAAKEIIDWSIPGRSIFKRQRPLSSRTMDRIMEGIRRYNGAPILIAMEHGGHVRSVDSPINTITTAKGGAHALAEPFLVKFYNDPKTQHQPVTRPLDTVTTKGRFGLVQPTVEVNGQRYLVDIRFRMLQPHELAGAQGFPKDYQFTGNKTQMVKQIGNAVPVNLARAIVRAVVSQSATHN